MCGASDSRWICESVSIACGLVMAFSSGYYLSFTTAGGMQARGALGMAFGLALFFVSCLWTTCRACRRPRVKVKLKEDEEVVLLDLYPKDVFRSLREEEEDSSEKDSEEVGRLEQAYAESVQDQLNEFRRSGVLPRKNDRVFTRIGFLACQDRLVVVHPIDVPVPPVDERKSKRKYNRGGDPWDIMGWRNLGEDRPSIKDKRRAKHFCRKAFVVAVLDLDGADSTEKAAEHNKGFVVFHQDREVALMQSPWIEYYKTSKAAFRLDDLSAEATFRYGVKKKWNNDGLVSEREWIHSHTRMRIRVIYGNVGHERNRYIFFYGTCETDYFCRVEVKTSVARGATQPRITAENFGPGGKSLSGSAQKIRELTRKMRGPSVEWIFVPHFGLRPHIKLVSDCDEPFPRFRFCVGDEDEPPESDLELDVGPDRETETEVAEDDDGDFDSVLDEIANAMDGEQPEREERT